MIQNIILFYTVQLVVVHCVLRLLGAVVGLTVKVNNYWELHYILDAQASTYYNNADYNLDAYKIWYISFSPRGNIYCIIILYKNVVQFN